MKLDDLLKEPIGVLVVCKNDQERQEIISIVKSQKLNFLELVNDFKFEPNVLFLNSMKEIITISHEDKFNFGYTKITAAAFIKANG